MSVSYTCPNPDCGVTLKTPSRVPAGKKVKCPKCGRQFVPEPEEPPAAGPGTFKLADEPAKPAAAAKKNPRAHDDDEDPESVKKGYGVVKETEEEVEHLCRIRQRQQFHRKIRGLTAMDRMSAYTLIGLPFVVELAIFTINREYMQPLISTSSGHKLLMLIAVMMTFGTLLLKKIVSFKG